MNYKIALSNKKYNMHIGKDTKNFIIKKTEDVVRLRFDEDNQVFYAKIENPSQHTRYLFQQHRLAISLSKLNTGRSQRRKMGDPFSPGERYWDEVTQEWQRVTDFYVKKKCHPRWSRCGSNGVVLHEVVSSLDEEIEIPFNSKDLKPNQNHTLGARWTNCWYNSIKAVLVSCFTSLTTTKFNEGAPNSRCRAYKTMSNRIKIEYDYGNDKIINRKNRQNKPITHKWVSITKDVNNDYRYYIEKHNIDTPLYAYLAIKDVMSTQRSGKGKRKYAFDAKYKQYHRKCYWRKNPDNQHYLSIHFCQLHGNTVHTEVNDGWNDLSSIIQNYANNCCPTSKMGHLISLINRHGGTYSITRRLYIVISNVSHDFNPYYKYHLNSEDGVLEFDTGIDITF